MVLRGGMGAKGVRVKSRPFAEDYKKKPAGERSVFIITGVSKQLLLFLETKLLNIDGLLKCYALLDGRLLEVLTGTHLTDGTGLFELALEFFQGSFDVFAFFDGYDDHCFYTSFFFWDCKGRKKLQMHKII